VFAAGDNGMSNAAAQTFAWQKNGNFNML